MSPAPISSVPELKSSDAPNLSQIHLQSASTQQTSEIASEANKTSSFPNADPPSSIKPDWQEVSLEPAFHQFAEWYEHYEAASGQVRDALLEEGRVRASERRTALKALIQTDPEQALALAIPWDVRRRLPPEISAQLEERVSGRGHLRVAVALPEHSPQPGGSLTLRSVELNGRKWQAYVYGRRKEDATRLNLALSGMAVDDVIAVHENAVRVLEPDEIIVAKTDSIPDPYCEITGRSITNNNEETFVEVAGQVQRICLCSVEHMKSLEQQNRGGDPQSAEDYTEGLKSVLLIRVDFPDLIGLPTMTEASGSNLVLFLNNFYLDNSYHKIGFAMIGQGSDVTPILRMPNPTTYYTSGLNYETLRNHALAAAATAGYPMENYDFDVTCMGFLSGYGWLGLGNLGSRGVWLRNAFSPDVISHEIGHNLGLNHANFWNTGGQSIIGSGSSVDYGDFMDTMGGGYAGMYHFNSRYKNYLGWLDTNEVITPETNGVYRIYAHDNTNGVELARSLKVPRNSGQNYWVEFRQKFLSNP